MQEGNTELASFLVKGAQLPGSTIAQIDVPYRGRQLKIAGRSYIRKLDNHCS